MGEWLRRIETWPMGINLAVFAVCALVVWVAGTGLARHCKTIAQSVRGGQALVGSLLLGAMVSLPELVVSTTAALMGNVELALNTLLGGIAATMAAAAVTDLYLPGPPIASRVRRPVVLMQGCMVLILLTLSAMGFATGDVRLGGVGAWSVSIAAVYLGFVYLIHRLRRADGWAAREDGRPGNEGERPRKPLRGAVIATAVAAAVILAAGAAMTFSANALATQTGLGASFMGLVFGGVVTSLPELSASISASRHGQHDMVYADIFGSNLLSLALLLLVDACSSGGLVFEVGGDFALLATLLGALVTGISLIGLLIRPRLKWGRAGPDAVVILAVTVAGYVLLQWEQ